MYEKEASVLKYKLRKCQTEKEEVVLKIDEISETLIEIGSALNETDNNILQAKIIQFGKNIIQIGYDLNQTIAIKVIRGD